MKEIFEYNKIVYIIKENFKSWSVVIEEGKLNVSMNFKKIDYPSISDVKHAIIKMNGGK